MSLSNLMDQMDVGCISCILLRKEQCRTALVEYPRSKNDDTSNWDCGFPINKKNKWQILEIQSQVRVENDRDWFDWIVEYADKRHCLQFHVEYLVVEEVGLTKLRIAVFCELQAVHLLQIYDEFERNSSKSFEFDEHSQVLHDNCSSIYNLRFKLNVNEYLKITRSNSSDHVLLGKIENPVSRNEECSCSNFERFEEKLERCGNPTYHSKIFGDRTYRILLLLFGVGFTLSIVAVIFNFMKNS